MGGFIDSWKKWYSRLTFKKKMIFTIDFWRKKWYSWLTFGKKMILTIDFWKRNDLPKGKVNIACQLIHTFTVSKDSDCFIFHFEIKKKNVFNASDLIFTGCKYHMLLFFLEQEILSEMFYFKWLKKVTWHLSPVNIKSRALFKKWLLVEIYYNRIY